MGAVESAVVGLRGVLEWNVRWSKRYREPSLGRNSPDSSWTCVTSNRVEIQAPKQPHHMNAG